MIGLVERYKAFIRSVVDEEIWYVKGVLRVVSIDASILILLRIIIVNLCYSSTICPLVAPL